jgi:DNA polymerase I-like protein with 3'-5' exonuclease and polymerase domains
LKDLLESSLVVGHNLKFDLKFMKHHFNIEPTNIFDTYIAEILIRGGQKARRKGTATLEAVAKQYTGIQLNKSRDVRMSFNGGELTEEQIKYAAMDVAVLPEIHKKQQEQLRALGLEKVFEIEMGCIPATVWLELSGLPLDMEGLNRVKGETKQKIEDSKIKVKTLLKESGYKNMDLFGLPAVNLDSPIQLLAAMKVIGLKINSTGDEVLSGIVHPIGKAIKEYRKQQKLLYSRAPCWLNSIPFILSVPSAPIRIVLSRATATRALSLG